MTLAERIRSDLEQALRRADKVRCSVLRLVLAGIRNTEIDQQKTLDDAGILDVMDKEAKKRRESIKAFEKGNRQDLVDKEVAEMAVLEKYLPEQMPREDIIAIAKKAIDEVGAQGPHEKGKVMGRLMPQLKGKADGGVINAVVT